MSKVSFKQFLTELDRADLEWGREITQQKQAAAKEIADRQGVTPQFGKGIQKGDVLEYKGKFWPLLFSAKGVHPKGMKDKTGRDMWFQPNRFKDTGRETELGKRVFIPT